MTSIETDADAAKAYI